jgi:lipoate-protein ligase A
MIERLLVCQTGGTDPYRNLALEHYLTRTVPEGTLILYLWQNERTVVIGRNQNLFAECDVRQLRADGGHPARRLSGGGAVYHDLGNLNFSFCAGQPDYDVARQLTVVRRALEGFGLTAEVSGRNDLLVNGAKVSGGAYLQEGRQHCHHGTLLVAVDRNDMVRYLTPAPVKLQAKGVASVRSRVANLTDFAPQLTVAALKKALIRALEAEYGQKARKLPDERIDADWVGQEATHLSSDDWLYGHDPQATAFSGTHRFAWGTARLAVVVRGGTVWSARLETDANDARLGPLVAQLFSGRAYDCAALLQAAQHSGTAVGADLALLLEELFDGNV